jgi:glycosyltransferase involved in cell wall biosynthesis
MKNPLVSIITVSYNSKKTIVNTIESILIQDYEKIEHVIVDGLSNDDTINTALSFKNEYEKKGYVLKIIQEKDDGIYDAMNKGIKISEGQIVGILNSDDFYSKSNVISKVVGKMILENAECLISNINFVQQNNVSKIVRVWRTKIGNFNYGWNPPHPSTFLRKEVYKIYGFYRTDFKISSDYDLLYRVIHKGKIKVIYLDDFIVNMRIGGASTRNIKSNITATKEIYRSLKSHKHRLILIVILIRLFRKIGQYFKKY